MKFKANLPKKKKKERMPIPVTSRLYFHNTKLGTVARVGCCLGYLMCSKTNQAIRRCFLVEVLKSASGDEQWMQAVT